MALAGSMELETRAPLGVKGFGEAVPVFALTA
jgi:hypothetical protein